ncbi:GNAT family N-acetyltransferase [Flagellimonas sp. 2504JD1-5]
MRSGILPIYVNTGKHLTSGQHYIINEKDKVRFSNKVLYVHDVPEYFKVSDKKTNLLRLYKIKRYHGYLLNLKQYADFDDFVSKKMSAKMRYNMRKAKQSLNHCLDNIQFRVFFGEHVRKEEYDRLVDAFFKLLEKRAARKKKTIAYLNSSISNFIKQVFYPLVKKRKAVIFAIYHDGNPIAINLNYLSESILFGAFSVFDDDYSKFGIGHLNLIEHIKWCFKNKISKFDFSKGQYSYKEKFCDSMYFFEDHILYNPRSLKSSFIAFFLAKLTLVKKKMKDYGILKLIVAFKVKALGQEKQIEMYEPSYRFTKVHLNQVSKKTIAVNPDNEPYNFLKKPIFDWLYKNSENYKNVKVLSTAEKNNIYFLKVKTKIVKIDVL